METSTATDTPVREVADARNFDPASSRGASRYRHTFEGGRHLDALLINEGSDVLIVTFHGAANRGTWQLPRFERLATTAPLGQSMLFLSDPALFADDTLELAWYTGWEGVDLQPILADWAVAAAQAVGASRVVFSGSSGGGFAALQVSALVPGSLAVAFNPQASIHGYLAGGTSYSAQRKFASVLHPELAASVPAGTQMLSDWTAGLGDHMSALARYSAPLENHVLYVDNINDFHHEQHMRPLLAAAKTGGNDARFRVHTYSGSIGHTPPSPAQFTAAMAEALDWCRELPPTL